MSKIEKSSARLLHTYPVKDSTDRESTFYVVFPAVIFGMGLGKTIKVKRSNQNISGSSEDTLRLMLDEPRRCVHMVENTNQDTGEITLVRCSNPSLLSVHGFSCETHILGQYHTKRANVEAQIIADIIATERAALKDAKRQKLRFGSEDSITYLVR